MCCLSTVTNPLGGLDFISRPYIGQWLCVDAELAIGQLSHGTSGLNNPWHRIYGQPDETWLRQ